MNSDLPGGECENPRHGTWFPGRGFRTESYFAAGVFRVLRAGSTLPVMGSKA